MGSITLVTERLINIEEELSRYIEKMKPLIVPEKSESFAQTVEVLEDTIESIVTEAIETLPEEIREEIEPATSVKESLDAIKAVSDRIEPEQKQDLEEIVCEIEKQWHDSYLDLLPNLAREARLRETPEAVQLQRGWHRLRKQSERWRRRIILRKPASLQELEAALMWMAEQGREPEDLNALRNTPENLVLQSENAEHLLEIAEKKVDARIKLVRANVHRVFCTLSEVEEFSVATNSELIVFEAYPAFVLVSIAPNSDTILRLRELYPIEQLTVNEDSSGSPESKEPLMRDYIVKFVAPVRDDWKQQLESLGAKILQPLGNSTVAVSVADETVIARLKDFDRVAYVEPYTPRVQIDPESFGNVGQPVTDEAIAAAKLRAADQSLDPDHKIKLSGILIANFFTTENRDRAATHFETAGIQVAARPGAQGLVLDLTTNADPQHALEVITHQPGLRSLEEQTLDTLFNDVARSLIARGVFPSNPHPIPNELALTGKGETIAISDTGIDTGDLDTLHPDLRGRVKLIQSYPIRQSLSNLVDNPQSDDGASDRYSGHGTHVAGSAIGNGTKATSLGLSPVKGVAPEAELIFQAIEQTPKWNTQAVLTFLGQKSLPPVSGLYGLPDDLTELFQHAYTEGSRIYSISWGGGIPGSYSSTRSYVLDEFVFQNKDFLVVVAAGNSGRHSSSGIPAIDSTSVDPPGTAKNCLTVGASENDRASQFSDTYGNRDPQRFPYEPFRSDSLVDSIDDIAAFSSRGPCRIGRRKPDLLAPGTMILSTRSSRIPYNNFAEGVCPGAKDHYMYMSGTSMATPLVSGCAALSRQYLREFRAIPNPSAALVKATLIHAAQYINYRFARPESAPWADQEQGWGRIHLASVLNPTPPTQVEFIDQSSGLVTGEADEYSVEIQDDSVPLRVTLVYTDAPGENLVNNLNLIVYSPTRKYYYGNDFTGTGRSDSTNNVEGVIIDAPSVGTWRIKVVASEVLQAQQDYAIVASGGNLTLGTHSRIQ